MFSSSRILILFRGYEVFVAIRPFSNVRSPDQFVVFALDLCQMAVRRGGNRDKVLEVKVHTLMLQSLRNSYLDLQFLERLQLQDPNSLQMNICPTRIQVLYFEDLLLPVAE